MDSRKWLYSYRILTAKLREGTDSPKSPTASFAAESAPPQPQQIPVNDELTEGEPAKPALFLTAGRQNM
ncbi:MAG: hypothetical protein EXQ58_01615 [Acidobacteria bacterium]|nr:hypothetical protein [Acidobacteriota bacterium]